MKDWLSGLAWRLLEPTKPLLEWLAEHPPVPFAAAGGAFWAISTLIFVPAGARWAVLFGSVLSATSFMVGLSFSGGDVSIRLGPKRLRP